MNKYSHRKQFTCWVLSLDLPSLFLVVFICVFFYLNYKINLQLQIEGLPICIKGLQMHTNIASDCQFFSLKESACNAQATATPKKVIVEIISPMLFGFLAIIFYLNLLFIILINFFSILPYSSNINSSGNVISGCSAGSP